MVQIVDGTGCDLDHSIGGTLQFCDVTHCCIGSANGPKNAVPPAIVGVRQNLPNRKWLQRDTFSPLFYAVTVPTDAVECDRQPGISLRSDKSIWILFEVAGDRSSSPNEIDRLPSVDCKTIAEALSWRRAALLGVGSCVRRHLHVKDDVMTQQRAGLVIIDSPSCIHTLFHPATLR